MTNNMHRFEPLLYCIYWLLHVLAVVLPSSGSFWIRFSYLKIQISLVVYHITLFKWPVCRSQIQIQIQIYLHSIYLTRITIVLTDVGMVMLVIIIC
jgi:hypothetical protein